MDDANEKRSSEVSLEANGALNQLCSLLARCAETFDSYGNLHAEKGSSTGLLKAVRNATMAAEIRATLHWFKHALKNPIDAPITSREEQIYQALGPMVDCLVGLRRDGSTPPPVRAEAMHALDYWDRHRPVVAPKAPAVEDGNY